MALRLHAITLADAHFSPPSADGKKTNHGLKLVPFRDLCAVVSEQKMFTLDEPTPEQVEYHRSVVDSVFSSGSVLPAPVGVVFRAPDVLKRWMELQ